MQEKIHAVIFKNGQKKLFPSHEAVITGTDPKNILLHRAFKSEVDAAMWLNFPDEFPTEKCFFAVKVGRCPGIYRTSREAMKQVKGVSHAVWQSFYTIEAAKKWLGFRVSIKYPSSPALPVHDVVGVCYCSIHPVGALKIYTDASFKNTDKVSYAVCVIDDATGMKMTFGGKAWGIIDSSEAELYAMVMALRAIGRGSRASISIYTDCQYLFNHVYSGKGKGDLWKEFFGYARIFDISVNWVKGHSDDEYNVLCDKLAGQLNK